MGHYHYDCDEYCEDCLLMSENSREVDYDTGEQDSPANCCVCHRPLDYSLTREGVKYVLDAIRQSLRDGAEQRNTIHDCYKDTYYEGSRHCEIVRDWARDLENYGGLTTAQRILISEYLSLTNTR